MKVVIKENLDDVSGRDNFHFDLCNTTVTLKQLGESSTEGYCANLNNLLEYVSERLFFHLSGTQLFNISAIQNNKETTLYAWVELVNYLSPLSFFLLLQIAGFHDLSRPRFAISNSCIFSSFWGLCGRPPLI